MTKFSITMLAFYFVALPAFALEKIDDALVADYHKNASQALERGHLSKAQEYYEKLADQVRLRRVYSFLKYFPEAPNGWVKSGNVQMPTKPLMGEGLVSLEAEQEYIHETTKAKIEIELSVGRKDFFKRLEQLRNNSKYQWDTYKGFEYYFKNASKAGKESKFRLVTTNGASYEIEGENMTLETAKSFLDNVDFSNLEIEAK